MTGSMTRRLLYIPVLHIDTNVINARQKLSPVNKLEKWFADGVILINMSGTAHEEAQVGGNEQRSRKANQQLFTMTSPAQPDESRFKAIEAVLFPDGAKNDNQKNDVRIVADAIHYAAILVTQDGGSKSQPGGILGNRDTLAKRFSVRILTPDEAVAFVLDRISERDDSNRQAVDLFGGELPDWTGQD
jgi:hypothetical protein